MEQEKSIWVIGHKNPDTDSVCAAIAYADLKNKTGNARYEARRAGQINEESRYVLEYFQVPVPEYVSDVGAQVQDIEIRYTNLELGRVICVLLPPPFSPVLSGSKNSAKP